MINAKECKLRKGFFRERSCVVVIDNGGKTIDRFTVAIDDAVYGMSSDPFSPQGFNQYAGETGDIDNWKSLGRRLPRKKVPKNIMLAIDERIKLE